VFSTKRLTLTGYKLSVCRQTELSKSAETESQVFLYEKGRVSKTGL